ncbi:MAG: nucleotide exchange factor GrpE [Anaerolineae bacterium]
MTEEQEMKPGPEEQAQEVEQGEDTAAEAGAEVASAKEGEAAAAALEALQKELDEARAKEAEYLDGWQRARAELANARKRFQKEQQQSYANAKADVLVRLLPIVDDFERAFDTLPEDLSGQPWIEGIRLIQQKAQGLLAQEGVEPIDAVGQEFDPFRHQAVTHEPSGEVPAGEVIAEMQRGYRMGDRVLRPSMVRVSSGPLPEPEPEEPISEEQASDTEEETEIIDE